MSFCIAVTCESISNTKKKGKYMKITLDDTKTIAFPNSSTWALFYSKFYEALVQEVRRYSITVADAEDAVAEAFHKLMHKKDREAYGEKIPQTEKGWFWALYWQSRSYLSHLHDHANVHAKYVERISQELDSVFACGNQGEEMDRVIRNRALARALKTLKADQDLSRRDLEVFVSRTKYAKSSKEVARVYGITANHVDQIVYRVRRIVQKYGPHYFEEALRWEGYCDVA